MGAAAPWQAIERSGGTRSAKVPKKGEGPPPPAANPNTAFPAAAAYPATAAAYPAAVAACPATVAAYPATASSSAAYRPASAGARLQQASPRRALSRKSPTGGGAGVALPSSGRPVGAAPSRYRAVRLPRESVTATLDAWTRGEVESVGVGRPCSAPRGGYAPECGGACSADHSSALLAGLNRATVGWASARCQVGGAPRGTTGAYSALHPARYLHARVGAHSSFAR